MHRGLLMKIIRLSSKYINMLIFIFPINTLCTSFSHIHKVELFKFFKQHEIKSGVIRIKINMCLPLVIFVFW